jgi:Rrf2 family iron-sulfur cluster assembly transcriptional regulator
MYLNESERNAITILKELNHTTPVKLDEVVQKFKLSGHFAYQIARKLRNAGLVKTVRGPGGGFCLNKENITVLDVSDVMTPKTKVRQFDIDDHIRKALSSVMVVQ